MDLHEGVRAVAVSMTSNDSFVALVEVRPYFHKMVSLTLASRAPPPRDDLKRLLGRHELHIEPLTDRTVGIVNRHGLYLGEWTLDDRRDDDDSMLE